MHYLGYCELSDGRKVHCLRAKKVSSAEEVNIEEPLKLPPRLATKRSQGDLANPILGHRDPAPPPKRQQASLLNPQATKALKTIPQPHNTARNMQKPSHMTTPSPAPTSTAPTSAVRPQQRQQRPPQQRQERPPQMRQQPQEEEETDQQKGTTSSILPDWVRRAQLVESEQPPQSFLPPLPQRQQQRQQQQEPEGTVPPPPPPPPQQRQQPGEAIDVFVSRFLRNQRGLDLVLVGRAVARYFKLNREEKESFRAMMLDLAEAPSVEALQAFLEGMVEQH
jgi:hypothetical protein